MADPPFDGAVHDRCTVLFPAAACSVGWPGAVWVAHPGRVNEPTRVCQLKLPLVDRYSFVYQNVQSSVGSMAMLV